MEVTLKLSTENIFMKFVKDAGKVTCSVDEDCPTIWYVATGRRNRRLNVYVSRSDDPKNIG